MTTKNTTVASLATHLGAFEPQDGHAKFDFKNEVDQAVLAEYVVAHLETLEVLTFTDEAEVIDAGESASVE